MHSKSHAFVAAVFVLSSCRTPVAYRFQAASVLDEPDVKTEISLDPIEHRRISVRITNTSDQVIQVSWRRVTLVDQRGTVTMPQPSLDLGWVKPGETQVAELTPFSLPDCAPDADAYQGMRFALYLPMVVRSEPRVLTQVFTAQVSHTLPAGEAR